MSKEELDSSISYGNAFRLTWADWLTCAEAAALSGTSESGWRNRCAAGLVPGATKKGKQWLIPRTSVTEARNSRRSVV